MKTRTMVYLDVAQHRRLKARARAEGISLAEMVRRCVSAHLEESPDRAPVPRSVYERLVALGSSGQSDVAEHHDQHLADALAREHAG